MRKNLNPLWAFFVVLNILLLVFPAVSNAEITMTSRVDRTKITIDENVLLTVTLNINGNFGNNLKIGRIDFPETKDFEVVGTSSQNQMTMINGRTSRAIDQIFSLIPSKSGKLMIPNIKNFYIDPTTGKKIDLETPPIDIIVEKVVEEKKEKIKREEITPPEGPKSPFSFIIKVILSTIILIIILTFILSSIFKRKYSKKNEDSHTFDLKLENNVEAEKIRKSNEVVNKEINTQSISREKLQLLAREDSKKFAREIARLGREILEKGCGKDFTNKTSDEIIEMVEYLRLGGEAKDLITDIFTFSDSISYCGGNAEADELEEIIEKIRRLKQVIEIQNRR